MSDPRPHVFNVDEGCPFQACWNWPRCVAASVRRKAWPTHSPFVPLLGLERGMGPALGVFTGGNVEGVFALCYEFKESSTETLAGTP